MATTSRGSPIALRLKASVYVLVLVAAAAFAVTDRKSDYPSAWFAMALMGAAIAWLLVEYPLHLKIPKVLINTLLLLAAGYLCYEVVQELANDSIILSLGHFIIALMTCKLLESKTQRDLVQIIILTLLVVVAGTMFSSTNLAYPVILVGYVALLTYVVQLMHLREQSDAAGNLPLPAVLPIEGALALLKRDLVRVTWRSLVLIAPIALVVFLVIPRARSAGLMSTWGAGMYQTGFSETVQFHDYGQLVQSENVVMEVKLTKNGENVGSEFYEPYFRGQVMETYRLPMRMGWGNGWVHIEPMKEGRLLDSPFVPLENGVAALAGEGPRSSRDKLVQEYTLKAPINRAIFVISPPTSFWNDKLEAVMFNKDDMVLRTDGGSPQHYFVYSSLYPWPADPRVPATIEPGLLAPKTGDLPAVYVSPQIQELAHRLSGLAPGETVPLDQISTVAAQFESYLKANYPYSLTFERKDKSLDPTTDFLLNRKETGGHCEYFASAMVMLCRAVGMNARMVGGYHGGEYNSIGGYYTVRQKDAHTWAEVYVPDTGWVLYDPSPIHAAASGGPMFLVRWVRELGQIGQNLWFSTVVSFDNESRRAAFNWVTSQLSVLWEFKPENLGIQVITGTTLLGMCGGAVWFMRSRRKAIRNPARGARSAPGWRLTRSGGQIAFLDDLMRLLARKTPRQPDLTPREYVHAVLGGQNSIHMDPRLAEEAHWLVNTAYALRFGTTEFSDELRDRIAHRLTHLRTALREPTR